MADKYARVLAFITSSNINHYAFRWLNALRFQNKTQNLDTVGEIYACLLAGLPVPSIERSFPRRILKYAHTAANYDIDEPPSYGYETLVNRLCLLLTQFNFPADCVLRAMNELAYETELMEGVTNISEGVVVDKEMLPAVWILMNLVSDERTAAGDTPLSVVPESRNISPARAQVFSAKCELLLLHLTLNQQMNYFCFIKYIITIYYIYIFHIIIYINMALQENRIVVDKEILTTGKNEYTKGAVFRGNKVQGQDHMAIIKKMMDINVASKRNAFCLKCCDTMHINPENCIRRCSLCAGNHWRKECSSFNRCHWCGNARGAHTCADLNLSDLFLTCPICKCIGHCANKYSPLYVVLSQLFGPLRLG